MKIRKHPKYIWKKIEKYQSGKGNKNISKSLKIPRSTVRSIVKEYGKEKMFMYVEEKRNALEGDQVEEIQS